MCVAYEGVFEAYPSGDVETTVKYLTHILQALTFGNDEGTVSGR